MGAVRFPATEGQPEVASRSVAVLRDKLYTARNKVLVRGLGGRLPYYLINEFPKSGGTWLTQMVSDAIGLPYYRNDFVRLEPSVVHGHYLNPALLRNVVVLWRDPRDLLVSYYHHCFFVAEFHDAKFGNKQLVARMRERCPFADYDDVRGNLPAFIRFVSTTPVAPRYTWPEFVAVWADRPGTVQARYEALRGDPARELRRIVRELTGQPLAAERSAEIAELRSFARAKRAADDARDSVVERSFVRQGSVGGWRDSFSDAALAELDRFGYSAAMAKLGYQR